MTPSQTTAEIAVIPENINTVQFKTRIRPYLIIAPALLVTIGILIPFAMSIFYSLTNFDFRRRDYDFVGLRNWIGMFTSDVFWHALWVTIRYAFFSTGFALLFGLGVAMLLTSIDNAFSRILRVALVFPLMVAPVISTLIWNLMLNNSVGIVERFLNLFGIFGFPWHASHGTAMMTAVMIDVWVNTPFVIVLIMAGLQSLPKSPFESAKIDGGSAWFNFRKLTLPILKPYIYVALLFRLMASLQEFGIIFALTSGGPGNTLMNLSLSAHQRGFRFFEVGISLTYILFLWVVIFILAKQIVKRWQIAQRTATGRMADGSEG
ncbi:MAG: sugar ABC transporter permease [Oscillospiraceae bacterium]|nr:sugar ABC transporter permease [Oscillospiraceae bacterium]